MKAPSFWWSEYSWWHPFSLITAILTPVSHIYARIVCHRLKAIAPEVNIPVISVGNFTVGGAGKTPSCVMLIKLLYEIGLKPVVVSKGFKGRALGPILVNSKQHTATEVGDEAILLSSYAPVIVAKNRLSGVNKATVHGNIVVIDDGLQNRQVAKDFSIAVISARQKTGNGKVMPAGPLRAPLPQQLALVDVIFSIVSKLDKHTKDFAVFLTQLDRPVFTLTAKTIIPTKFKGKSVIAWCGIADGGKFFADLEQSGCNIVTKHEFGDHVMPTRAKALYLVNMADKYKLPLVTTAKDYARLNNVRQTELLDLKQRSEIIELKFELVVNGMFISIHKKKSVGVLSMSTVFPMSF